ncbi:MAG: glycerol-3-phosphate acyltransferase, partial [Psychromonas sp.]|nr:glycerol-3-phosphate acyltransferase [Psychromonas sp.]
MIYLTTLLLIIFAYLFGGLNGAILLCRLKGWPDPRTQGSKNPGTTNILRFHHAQAAS